LNADRVSRMIYAFFPVPERVTAGSRVYNLTEGSLPQFGAISSAN
jgi:hypothetical protein